MLYLFLSGVSGVRQAIGDGAGLGSNGWAIAPSRSADGHAMLLANPHLLWDNEILSMKRILRRLAIKLTVRPWSVTQCCQLRSTIVSAGRIL